MGQGIWLLGVVHRDPEGEARLLGWLRKLAPRAVGLELAAPSVDARRLRGDRLRARLAAGLRGAGRADLADGFEAGEPLPGVAGELAAAIELPFELRAAEAWAKESGAEVALLDEPGFAAQAVALLEAELFEPANVAALLEEEAKVGRAFDPVFQQYALARRYFGNPGLFRYHFRPEEVASMEARDAHALAGLEALVARAGSAAYVAGWEHLVDGGFATIGPRLGDRAVRRLICDPFEEKEAPP